MTSEARTAYGIMAASREVTAMQRPHALRAALVALLPVILVVGMLPALALFIVFCLKLAERMSWQSTLTIAVGATAGSWLLFERLLQVQLPRGMLG